MSKQAPANNANMLYIVIILLLVVIAVLAFFVGKSMGNTVVPAWTTPTVQTAEDLTVTVIDDTRCTSCNTADIVNQLKQTPFLSAAEFINKDFSDEGMEEYITENNITTLPAVIFSSNQLADNGAMTNYLTALPTEGFSLQIGSSFDPFAERSDRGFLVASEETLSSIKDTANYKGAADAQITWVEYTDVNCHYCKKMESDGTWAAILEKYPNDVNKTVSNYIGVGWAASQTAAEALECVSANGWADAFNAVISSILLSGDNGKSNIIKLATEQGVSEDAINTCLENGDTKDLVASKFALGRDVFGITGTPGNVLIHNETGEFEILSGAYPAENFEAVIDRLLK